MGGGLQTDDAGVPTVCMCGARQLLTRTHTRSPRQDLGGVLGVGGGGGGGPVEGLGSLQGQTCHGPMCTRGLVAGAQAPLLMTGAQ